MASTTLLQIAEIDIAQNTPPTLSHLKLLEAESIHIFREVAAEFEKPVMLYSIGKDSSVMLRLAQKAFYPCPIPFPLLHVDTGYKFREMLEFRDAYTHELGLNLLVWHNEAALADGANPVTLGTQRCCGFSRPQRCSTHFATTVLTQPSAEPAATKKNPGPRSASFRSAIAPASGTPRPSVLSSGTSTTAVPAPAKASASSRYPTGPNSTSGITSIWKTSPSCRFTSPRNAACWCAAKASSPLSKASYAV